MGHHSRPFGSLPSLGSTTTPRATAAIASRPKVREPGEKLGPTARMPTKAEAHRTTVTTTAATPSLLTGACPGGVSAGRGAGVGTVCGDPSWGPADGVGPDAAVVAMVPI